jgi:hypothetical protein
MSDIKNVSKERMEKALKALEQKEAQREKEKRYWAKQKLILKKAIAQGITVSDEEINEELAKRK